jgi:hypothetical protein
MSHGGKMKTPKVIKTAINNGGVVEIFKELDSGEVYIEVTIKKYLNIKDLKAAGLGHMLLEEIP